MSRDVPADNVEAYGIDPVRGFLPADDPLHRFADAPGFDRYSSDVREYLDELDALSHTIPDLLEDNRLRFQTQQMGTPPDNFYDELGDQVLFRVYQASSWLASAYVHKTGDDVADVDTIPAGIAVPLYEAADRLNVPPIMSYDAYSLHNWYRKNPDGPITLGNIDTIHNSVNVEDGFNDESWFMLVHVEIENEAADAITAIPDAQHAVVDDDPEQLKAALMEMDTALQDMGGTMARMTEENDPDNYGVYRPYIDGFEDVVYEGVSAFDGPQSFRGETGAQSSIYPALDRAFGVPHHKNELVKHIDDMLQYMPDGHRNWLHAVDAGPDITSYVNNTDDTDLHELHDSVLKHMISFRFVHWQFSNSYILDQSGDEEGTGGTDYTQFLPQLIEEAEEQLVGEPAAEHWMYLPHTFDEMPDMG